MHDLHLFVTVQLLEHTPAVLSLGKLCKEHGYTYEWPSGREPRLTQNGKQTFCKTENFVPVAVPGLSSNSSPSSSSTSHPQDHSLYPAKSRSNEEVAGNCNEQIAGNSSEGVPEWPEDFTESHEIADMPAAASSSHDSDPERPTKVASRKHCICIHFPKDQNCEVCKRTIIASAPCRRRTGEAVPRAEQFGDLTQANHKVLSEKISKQSSICSRGTRTWPPNGSSLIRAKPKLLSRRKEVYESFSSRLKSRESHLK